MDVFKLNTVFFQMDQKKHFDFVIFTCVDKIPQYFEHEFLICAVLFNFEKKQELAMLIKTAFINMSTSTNQFIENVIYRNFNKKY
jgi:hypothetical protein